MITENTYLKKDDIKELKEDLTLYDEQELLTWLEGVKEGYVYEIFPDHLMGMALMFCNETTFSKE